MDDFEKEIKVEFLIEAKELLTGTEQCFLDLEKDSSDTENLNKIFRLAHNLKGSSGAVGFSDLAAFTHKLESLLLELKEGRISATESIVNLLLKSNDYLIETIDILQGDLNASYANAELMGEMIAALEQQEGPQVETTVTTENISKEEGHSGPSPVEETSSFETSNEDAVAQSTSDSVLNFPTRSSPAPQADVGGGSGSSPSRPAAAAPRDENIRVSLSRIEKLINNVGELSVFQAVMAQQEISHGDTMSSLMRSTLRSMTKIIRETQNLSMSLRMLPIKQTFRKMERIVRDTSKDLNKDVELHLIGEETEIDKTVLEQLADPLVHLVRNAVDHGLEDNETREKLGKSRVGNVYLSASHRAGQVVIEIKDDGFGLNAEKLIAKAKSKKIISENAHLSQEEGYQLIFAPGFSTKEVVTGVSGRGVGMDVVKTNISALQGTISIETELGKGSCFRITLPLTMAIVEGVIINVDSQRYIVPLNQITEFYRPKKTDIHLYREKDELLSLRAETLGVLRLSKLIHKGIKEHPLASDLTALITRDIDGHAVAVLVDEVIAQQQIVIKPLGEELKGQSGFMGSAILGDGKPVLILDILELVKPYTSASQSQNSQKTKNRLEVV